MSTYGTRRLDTRLCGGHRRGARSDSSLMGSMPNLDTSETSGTPTAETGSQSCSAGIDALSHAILKIHPSCGRILVGGHIEDYERYHCTLEHQLKDAVPLLCNEVYQWWLTVDKGTQSNQITWDHFKSTFQSKYVRASFMDAHRLSNNYYKCIRFEECLRDNLRVLIASQREQVFAILVDKSRISKEVKRVERESRDRERGNNKMDSEPSSPISRPKKRVRSDWPPRVEVPVAPTVVQLCRNCGRHHLGKYLRRLGAFLRCGSMEHRIRDCPQHSNQVEVKEYRGKGVNQTEARQFALVYVTRPRKDKDTADVITSTLFIHTTPYIALINIVPTHSYIASSVFVNLGMSVKSTFGEITVYIQMVKEFLDVFPEELSGSCFEQFECNKEFVVYSDTSQVGLGCVLMEDGKVEEGSTTDFGLNNDGVLCFAGQVFVPNDSDLR
ncbi:uncharacterized protein [Gossypium hirsutum]|uniref:Uncharacterized protein n=1 Tax=Gossypium hirsutum TaxID=3635 RepID=A0A1U8J7A5_GOSHI|nr:uncharacterized protein LOC107902399 [Gossypium hirsutum]